MTSDLKCVSVCGSGYFIATFGGSNTCTKCDSPCRTCQITSTTCLSCVQASVTNKYLSLNNTCLSLCPDGYYADAGNICLACTSPCSTCQLDSISCLSCSSPRFFNSLTKTCVTSANCPFGTYADSTTSKCLACGLSCSGCTVQSTNCLACANGYI